MKGALATAIVVFAVFLETTAWARRKSECRQPCRCTGAETVGDCADDVAAQPERCEKARIRLKLCHQDATAGFDSCLDRCRRAAASPPGRCKVTRECVEDCRDISDQMHSGCEGQFAPKVRHFCTPACLREGRKASRTCLRQCLRNDLSGVDPSCVPEVGGSSRCGCQDRCIQNVVGTCLADCDDNCAGDPDALRLCQQACRNAQCQKLINQCSTGEDDELEDDAEPRNASYLRCCEALCDECEPTVNCEVTTTSTSLTTTSTSVASTSTTSLTTTTATTIP